jgi:hypothetical protein
MATSSFRPDEVSPRRSPGIQAGVLAVVCAPLGGAVAFF